MNHIHLMMIMCGVLSGVFDKPRKIQGIENTSVLADVIKVQGTYASLATHCGESSSTCQDEISYLEMLIQRLKQAPNSLQSFHQ